MSATDGTYDRGYDRGWNDGYHHRHADGIGLDVAASVLEFHEVFGCDIDAKLTREQRALRASLLAEEALEAHGELLGGDLPAIAKELADLVYVAYGAALTFGIDLDQAVKIVHASNMTKLWPDGTVHRREDGKVLKPPTYVAPDMSTVVREGS